MAEYNINAINSDFDASIKAMKVAQEQWLIQDRYGKELYTICERIDDRLSFDIDKKKEFSRLTSQYLLSVLETDWSVAIKWLLATPINYKDKNITDFTSVRAKNQLEKLHIETVWDLLRHTIHKKDRYYTIGNNKIGKKTAHDIIQLANYYITHMKLKQWDMNIQWFEQGNDLSSYWYPPL